MIIMGLICMKGNSTGEAQFWEMLSRLGCASIKEFSLGPQEGLLWKVWFSSNTLVQVPHTNSSEYECSWSPQSNMEITKMKALGSWPGFSTSQQSQSHAYLGPVLGPPFSTGEVGRKASEGLIGVISEKIVKL